MGLFLVAVTTWLCDTYEIGPAVRMHPANEGDFDYTSSAKHDSLGPNAPRQRRGF